MHVTNSAISENGKIAADVIDSHILLVTAPGPITPNKIYDILMLTQPFLKQFHDEKIPYGAIFHITEDPSVFADAVRIIAALGDDLVMRRAFAFVVDSEIPGGSAYVATLAEMYRPRFNIPVEAFYNDAVAIDWIKCILDEVK